MLPLQVILFPVFFLLTTPVVALLHTPIDFDSGFGLICCAGQDDLIVIFISRLSQAQLRNHQFYLFLASLKPEVQLALNQRDFQFGGQVEYKSTALDLAWREFQLKPDSDHFGRVIFIIQHWQGDETLAGLGTVKSIYSKSPSLFKLMFKTGSPQLQKAAAAVMAQRLSRNNKCRAIHFDPGSSNCLDAQSLPILALVPYRR
ncbi:MAG: hypothetical protein ACR2PT_16680 [Endozoicomonas sp.]